MDSRRSSTGFRLTSASFAACLTALLMLPAAPMLGQPPLYRLEVEPASPTTLDSVTVTVDSACLLFWEEPTFDAATLVLVSFEPTPAPGAPCSQDLPYEARFVLGPLQAGDYAVEIRLRGKDGETTLEQTGSFSVVDRASYRVAPGALIEGCGGIIGDCQYFRLEGTLSLEFDVAAEAASVADSQLRTGPVNGPLYPFPDGAGLQATQLTGEIEDHRVLFTSPAGSFEEVNWRLAPLPGALVLDGTWDQGCCDRFVFDFETVTLEQLDSPAPALYLREGRFEVSVTWTDFAGEQGSAHALPLGDGSGWFWFFAPDNAELLVKVIDGCASFGRYWFFAAGLTNVGVEIRVEDTAQNRSRVYENPLGQSFAPILDTDAFDTCS